MLLSYLERLGPPETRMKHLLLSSTILLAASTGLMAEEVGVGDPQAGFAYAKEVCANCHAIVSNETSPVPEAPAFDEIANRMTAKALLVWMQSRHPTMPNITLEREDLMDVIAYILSRKDKGRSDNQ
jgi:mono/diheme cytochrome c family protein